MTKDRSKAMTAFVLGLFFLVPLLNIFLAIIGLVFGILSLREIKAEPDRYYGQGYAIAGIVLCSLVLMTAVVGAVYLYYLNDYLSILCEGIK